MPVLVDDGLEQPIADSLEITHYLAGLFPDLIPSDHRADIVRLLEDLHALNFFSLSYDGQRAMTQKNVAIIQEKMAGDISSRYQSALAYKLEV